MAGEALHDSVGGVARLASDRTDLAEFGFFVVAISTGTAGVVGELVPISAGRAGSIALREAIANTGLIVDHQNYISYPCIILQKSNPNLR